MATNEKTDIYGIDFDGEEYADDFVRTDNLPLVQVLNPKDRNEEAIEAVKSYGLFIEAPRAEVAGFRADGTRWVEWSHRFGVKGGEKKPGFLSRNPRMLVLAQSEIEVYEKYLSGDRVYTKYVGKAYENGQPTEFNQAATLGAKIFLPEGERQQFSRVTRYLLMFLDDNNAFLHDTPFVMKATGGWAASLGAEFRTHIKAVSERYREYRASQGEKTGGGYLSSEAIAKTIFDIGIGWHMSTKGAAFIVPTSRLHPVANPENLGKEKVVKDASGTRDITLKGVKLGDLMFGKRSQIALAVDELLAIVPDFAKPPTADDREKEEPKPQPPRKYEPVTDDEWDEIESIEPDISGDTFDSAVPAGL